MTTNETTTHTPGPWEISKYGDGGLIVATADDEAALCQVFGTAQPEYAANARLIAAAPELLAALQWAQQFIPDNKGNCRETCRAAIAKATGQE